MDSSKATSSGPEASKDPSSSSKGKETKPRKKRVISRRGCLTCKARKVKCDEGRPACRRCVAAGRTCEGYGIWGGGGTYTNTDTQSHSSGSNPGSPQGPSGVSQEPVGAFGTFHWPSSPASLQSSIPAPAFDDLTSVLYAEDVAPSLSPAYPAAGASIPVPGVATGPSTGVEGVSSESWLPTWGFIGPPVNPGTPLYNDLIHRACQVEPLVLSAVTALTPIHQGGVGQWPSTPLCRFLTPTAVPQAESYADLLMHQYSQTMNLLRSHSANETDEINILELTLVSCVLLISLELLQGSPGTAYWHLRSGLWVLESMESIEMVGTPKVQRWILNSLRKFWLQFELLHLFSTSQSLLPLPLSLRVIDSPQQDYFESEEDARTQLQGILIDTIVLHQRSRQTRRSFSGTEPVEPWPGTESYHTISAEKSRVLQRLVTWDRQFEVSFLSSYYAASHHLMLAYRGIVSVLATASTHAEDEMVYDSLTSQFLDVVTWAAHSVPRDPEAAESQWQKEPQEESVSSVADLGFIIPLYITATKCRNGSVRHQALELMGMIPHKEGVWEPRSTGTVAKEVIKLEGLDLDMVTGARGSSAVDTSEMILIPEEQRCCVINATVQGVEARVEVKRGGEWMNTVALIA